jgi:hypothetical protein
MQDVEWNLCYNQSFTSYGFIDGPIVTTHKKTWIDHLGKKSWCHNTMYTIDLGRPSLWLWTCKWKYPSS